MAAVLNKLDNDNIYRYVRLEYALDLLGKLLDHPQLSKSGLTRKLAMVVHQQRQFYLQNKKTVAQYQQVLHKLDIVRSQDPQLT